VELRKDYILDRWVIISEGRGSRPKEFREDVAIAEGKKCFFCPGSEETTPPEIGRVEKDGGWILRWFPNKFPAVDKKGDAAIKNDDTWFTYSDAYGAHEIIVETPDHSKQLTDLGEKYLEELFRVYSKRIFWISKDDVVKYVCVFKNHGKKGGTSIVHSHSQVVGYNNVPVLVQQEVEASKKDGKCAYCEIIEKERTSNRLCFENDSFVAFAPYASRFNYEVWVFPKQHLKTIIDFSDKQFSELAQIMKKILTKIRQLGVDYNFFLHYAPDGEDLHFHIEVTPRIATWAGFELSSDTIINSVAPEVAAEFYRA